MQDIGIYVHSWVSFTSRRAYYVTGESYLAVGALQPNAFKQSTVEPRRFSLWSREANTNIIFADIQARQNEKKQWAFH